jgi:hypothetical protein
MARKRIKRTEYNIKYVHVANGRVVYRPYIKKSEMHDGIKVDSKNFLKPPINLGKPGDDPDKICGNYLVAKDQLKREKEALKNTLGWVVKKYLQSREYKDKAASTHKRDKNLKKVLDHKLKINGKIDTLFNLHISNITKPLFHEIAEKRLENYIKAGKKGVVQVNREITFLSGALSYATNSVNNLCISVNPLYKFKKIKEVGNTRYVTDEEYDIQYKEAVHIADYLQPTFELTYLLATRGIETLDIRLSDCTEEGIRTKRRKGSKDNIIEWSDRLRKAYELALERHKDIKILPIDPYLIAGFSGGQLAKSTLDDAVQRLKRHMKEIGKGDKYWSLHKLKSKGISDADDKNIAGHKSEQMKQKYDTKLHKIKPAN